MCNLTTLLLEIVSWAFSSFGQSVSSADLSGHSISGHIHEYLETGCAPFLHPHNLPASLSSLPLSQCLCSWRLSAMCFQPGSEGAFSRGSPVKDRSSAKSRT